LRLDSHDTGHLLFRYAYRLCSGYKYNGEFVRLVFLALNSKRPLCDTHLKDLPLYSLYFISTLPPDPHKLSSHDPFGEMTLADPARQPLLDSTQSCSPTSTLATSTENPGFVRRFTHFGRPYVKLARIDGLLGVWLTFWPCGKFVV
jgi:hypothetical protein